MMALILRDCILAFRAGGGAMLALAFFASVAALVPLGVGPEMDLLARIAGGVLWVAAALAVLLSLDRLFQADYDDGSLDILALSPMSLERVAAAKILSHWLTTGLPLTLLGPVLGLSFGLPGQAVWALMLALLMGTPALSAIGAMGASLTVTIRRGGLILPLIVLPLLSPVVIFGAGAVLSALDDVPNAAMGLLAAFSFVATLLAPFVAAAGVRLNLAG